MKKTIILSLAVVLVLAFAATAYASTTSTYVAWSSLAPNNNPATPHKGYTSATNKCSVCHAVHKASNTGQILLRSSAGDSCTYCHVNTVTGAGILTYWIYNGNTSAYSNDTTYASFGGGVAHNIGCSDCHAVHGAQTLDGNRTDKILKDWAYAPYAHQYSTFALAKWATPDTLGNQNEQVTAWCSGCHPYFVEAYEATIQYIGGPSDSVAYSNPTTPTLKSMKSHIMTDLVGGYGNPNGSLASGTDVAWSPSVYCRSCHDAGVTDGGPGVIAASFPHYTGQYYRFMTVGESMAASGSANTTGTIDGTCLKCHRQNGSTGIGFTF